ncbi:MAG: hypothetical protein WC867_05805 [Candidatus Pacearchaeota archaeon]|jgi:formylmethanofuran dehydrogenase subunit C
MTLENKVNEIIKIYDEHVYNKNIRCPDFFKLNKEFDRQYTSDEIQEFVNRVEMGSKLKNFNDYLGLFISSLINNSKEEIIKLKLNFLYAKVNDLGAYNQKTLIINGNVGNSLGWNNQENGLIELNGNCGENAGVCMNGGMIVINGNCDESPGTRMCGGYIEINGDCEKAVGWGMENGKIKINGNTKDHIGHSMNNGYIILNGNCGYESAWNMQNGRIDINGKYGSIADNIKKGDIYHKGLPLIIDGERYFG